VGTDKDRSGVQFALDRFAAEGGRLVVEGRWYGVAGRRFVRPVLQLEGQRRLIAVLDHKPWPADEGVTWVAAFVHKGDAGPARLQVSPDIAIELPKPGPRAGDGKPRSARVDRPPVTPPPRRMSDDEATEPPAAETPPAEAPAAGTRQAATAPAKTPRAKSSPAKIPPVEPPAPPAPAPTPPPVPPARPAPEPYEAPVFEAAVDSERLRSERDTARGKLERARAERDQARTDTDELKRGEQKVRSGMEKLQRERDDATALVERLRAEGNEARAAAGRALAERDAVRRELETLRRMPQPAVTGPVIAPRPMPFRDPPRRYHWGLRGVAIAGLVLLVAVLLYLLLAG
jgi:hypothetical protein